MELIKPRIDLGQRVLHERNHAEVNFSPTQLRVWVSITTAPSPRLVTLFGNVDG